jgi:ribonucleoside-triphosphate reductase
LDKYIKEYTSKADWRVKENSNTVFSIGGLKNTLAETALAKSALNALPKRVANYHKNHIYHIHDTSSAAGEGAYPYCAGWSLKDILLNGLAVDTRFPASSPAKHFGTALEHILNHCFILTNEFAGAQAYSSVDVYLAPFIKEDKLTYKEIKQQTQRLIFALSQKYRSGLQSPFSNITMDLKPLGSMKTDSVIVGGKELNYTYSDCQKEINLFNKAFAEVMSAGDSLGKPFSFPIPTYSMTKDFDWNSTTAKQIFTMAVDTGIPYFSNFVNSDMNPDDVRSMCCRLRLDKRELVKNGGGLFGAGELTGSIGVVTINIPRISFMAKNPLNWQVLKVLKEFPLTVIVEFFKAKTAEERLFVLLEEALDKAKDSLVIKRRDVEINFNRGLFPYTKVYLNDFSNHFNTIGLGGVNEGLLNLGYEKGILDPKGKNLAEGILDFMLKKSQDYQEEQGEFYKYPDGSTKGLLFNIEASPGEGSLYKLAKYDQEYFKGKAIVSNGLVDVDPYYTNSTWIPQDDEINKDVFAILDHQDSLQKKYTSGTVQHIYTEGKLTWQKGRDIIKKACENYEMPYFSLSPTITVCPVHGRLDKEYEFCPHSHSEKELAYIKKMGGIIVQVPKDGE